MFRLGFLTNLFLYSFWFIWELQVPQKSKYLMIVCTLLEAAMPGDVSNCQERFTAMTWCLHGSFCFTGISRLGFFKALSSQKIWTSGEVLLPTTLNMKSCVSTVRGAEGEGQARISVKLQVWPIALYLSCIWVSKEGWIWGLRALILSLLWITLYYVKDLISSKAWKCFVLLSSLSQSSLSWIPHSLLWTFPGLLQAGLLPFFLGEKVITFVSFPFAAGCGHRVNYGMVQTLATHLEILGTSGQEDKAAFELGAQHQSVPIQVR